MFTNEHYDWDSASDSKENKCLQWKIIMGGLNNVCNFTNVEIRQSKYNQFFLPDKIRKLSIVHDQTTL